MLRCGNGLFSAFVVAVASFTFAPTAFARDEKSYQNTLCYGMSQAVRLHDRTIMDCGTAKFAIEIDFSDKWAEAIGQAMHYAAVTERRPGVVLICKQGTSDGICLSHALRAESTLSYWGVQSILWRCHSDALMLSDCEQLEIDPAFDDGAK